MTIMMMMMMMMMILTGTYFAGHHGCGDGARNRHFSQLRESALSTRPDSAIDMIGGGKFEDVCVYARCVCKEVELQGG